MENNPRTTYSYGNPRQDAVFVDSVSQWVEDPETKRYAWDPYVKGSQVGGLPDHPAAVLLSLAPIPRPTEGGVREQATVR
ncbi:hypothetical protein ACFZBP_05735 [Streptomyces sp. NPDC008086]|uniref:hypothetical protein n=1 Tax=Streptomyces sp. NPDC008086 TaxID=3364807 RepID=UPI0036E757ED